MNLNKITEADKAIIREIADTIGANFYDVAFVMNKESGLNPAAVNGLSKAKGLIQIMPENLALYEKATKSKFKPTFDGQKKLIIEHFKPYRGKLDTVYNLYFATFFPKAIGKGDDFVLETQNLKASKIAQQNAGMDWNKDNKISVGEVKKWLLNNADYEKKNLLNL